MSDATEGPRQPSQLHYAPPPRLAWLSRRARLLIVVAIVVAVAWPAYRHRQTLMHRARWLYASRQCAAHHMPGPVDLIVTDPVRAQQLIAAGTDYVPRCSWLGSPTPGTPVAIYSPPAWRALERIDGRCQWIRSPFWTEPIAFLGSLRRPDGVSRLVVVRGASTNGYDLLCDVQVLVLPHPGLFDPLPPNVGGPAYAYSGLWMPATFRGGVVDPNDPSHVIFGFDVFDVAGTRTATGVIDAHLRDDDSLAFALRETPELTRLQVRLRRTRISGVIPQAFIEGPFALPVGR